jgi:serine/threonine protein kinase
MPAPCTADDFLTLVRKSGVVDAAVLAEFERRSIAEADSLPAQQLARRMIRDGVLTQLQAQQLIRGRWRGFFIGGKYKVLELLGAGGMGRVYLCEHSRMGRRVAIKVLPTERAADETTRRRFMREARAAAALDHPNIVRAHDIDTDGSGDKAMHFLVMEYVDGSSLQEIVSKFGPLSVERACHYVWQAAKGLEHAHAAGLVHRDIKPANLLLDRSGLVKVLDLGLARLVHDTADDLTCRLGGRNLIGTADYLAPEQAMDSHRADIRADIYSLGVTFHFLLTGKSPYKDGTIAQKLIYHRTQRPEPIRALRPEVPEAVAGIIERMLSKNPGDRFQEPGEVVDALDPWTESPVPPPPESEMPQLSRAARRAEPPTTPIPRSSRPTSHAVPAPDSRPASPPPRSRWAVLVGGCRSAAARVAGWFGRRRRPESRADAGPARKVPDPNSASAR